MTESPAARERDADDRSVLRESGSTPETGRDGPTIRSTPAVGLPGATVTVRRTDPSSVSVDVAGDIDRATVGVLAQCLLPALELPECRELFVDLSGVVFLGAAGVEVFAQAYARAAERAVIVCLVSVSRIARRALEVTDARGCFDTWPAPGEEGADTGHASDRARGVAPLVALQPSSDTPRQD